MNIILPILLASALLIGYFIRKARITKTETSKLKSTMREAIKVQALVIAIENSTTISEKNNTLCIQMLLRVRLEGNIHEGYAIWNVKPAFIPQVQPGCVLPVLFNQQSNRFFPDISWASHNASLASLWEKQLQANH